MFFIKNSVKNIYRYRSKYKLFGILYLVIILVFSICVNTFIQMGKITDNVVREYASVLKFDTYPRSISEQQKTRISKDEFLEYKNREYIDDIKIYRYIFSAADLKEDTPELKKDLHIDGEVISWGRAPKQPFVVYGYNMSLLYLDADSFKLEKGRMFEKDDEVVIYKNRLYQELGKGWNDLDIDDKIVLKNNDGIYKEFTVVGIKEQDPNDTEDVYQHIVYTTLESAEYFDSIALETIKAYPKTYTYTPTSVNDYFILGYEALIYIDSPSYFSPLRNELLAEGVRIESFFPDANALISLTTSMRTWSVIFMVLAGLVIICVAIISTNILLNTRKYEMAVLRSVGMKKSRLIINYLIENLTFIWSITIVSLIAAQFITPLVTKNVFTGMKELISVEMFENLTQGLNIELMMQNIGIVFGGTTIVIMLSLILACINIIRFEPLKIFNKQY